MFKEANTLAEVFEADYMEFVKWEATPYEFVDDKDNYPNTMQAFADKIKVSRQTLYDWRKKEGHWERVKEFYNTLHLRKSISVRDALYKRTQGVLVETENQKGETVYKDLPPDPKAIELWLKYEDKWQEKSLVEHSGNVTLNADEIRKVIEGAKE